MGNIIFPPKWGEDEKPSPQIMILNDEFIFSNIKNNESTEIELPLFIRPGPSSDNSILTTVHYTSQDVCNKESFKIFYKKVYGRSIKMSFEGIEYYGYIHSILIKDQEIDFVFTYTSSAPIPEEDFIGPPTL